MIWPKKYLARELSVKKTIILFFPLRLILHAHACSREFSKPNQIKLNDEGKTGKKPNVHCPPPPEWNKVGGGVPPMDFYKVIFH